MYTGSISKTMLTQRAAQYSVHPAGGSRCVFRQFARLKAGSVKMALSRLAHQRVTQTVETVEKIGRIQHKATGFNKDRGPYGKIQTLQ